MEVEVTMNKNKLLSIISTNSTYTILFSIWYLGSKVAIAPFVLSYVSLKEYGLWTYCFIILSYLSFTAFGVNTTYIRYTALYRAKNENKKLNQLLSTGIFSMVTLSSIILVLLYFVTPSLVKILGIENGLKRTSELMILGTAVIFVMNLTLDGFKCILEGEQRIDLVKRIQFVASFVEIVLIVLFFKMGSGIYSLLYAYGARYILVIISCIFFSYRVFPELKVSPFLFRLSQLRNFTSYGNKMSVLSILSMITNSVDRIIITKLLNLELTALYELGRKFPNIGLMLPSSIAGTLIPCISHLQGSDQVNRVREVYIKGTRYLMLLSVFLYGYIIFFGDAVMMVWLGDGFDTPATIMQILGVAALINLLTATGTSCFRGLGNPILEIKYMTVTLILVIVTMPFSIKWMGITGAALSFAFGGITGSIYFIILSNREFKIGFREYYESIIKPLLPVIMLFVPAKFILKFICNNCNIGQFGLLFVLIAVALVHITLVCAVYYLFRSSLFTDEESRKLKEFTAYLFPTGRTA